VMDNLGAHKPKRVKELISKIGAASFCISAGLLTGLHDPIEEAFSKI
jgi:hypothetical protein